MITLIYHKKSLHDSLLINLFNELVITIEGHPSYTIGFNKNHAMVFVNIHDVSKYLALPEGYLRVNDTIINFVKQITNIDISKYDNTKAFVIGHVKECVDIPDTHLHACQVDVGNNVLPIVCGAANVKANQKVVVAQVDTTLPNGITLKPNKLMGHTSLGMICSAKELNITNSKYNQVGIVELDSNSIVGSGFTAIFNN